MIEFKSHNGVLTCPDCKTNTNISLSIPIQEISKINVSKEVFCSNQCCEAKLRLTGTFIKKKKDPEGVLKINNFLFNGEEKDPSTYWHVAN